MADLVDEDFLDEGFMFDGSSIAGWKGIEASDMKLMPDTDSAYVDPFYAEKTILRALHVVEPDTGEPYNRDPRGTAQLAEAYLKSSGTVMRSTAAPRRNSFVFDDVRYAVSMNKVAFEVDAVDGAWNTDTDYEMGNMGHRPGIKGGYFPVNPIDPGQDLRSEMLSTMKRMGMKVDKHHHEVASNQHELGLIFDSLTKAGGRAAEIQVRHPQRGACLMASRRPSCPSRWPATTAPACTSTCRSGRTASRCLQATNTRPVGRGAVFHRRHPEECQDAERLHQPVDELLQSA